MFTHDLIQGSPEWLAHRAKFFNASDAPAMMGCSPYKTRSQLLHELHTGLAPEVDAGTQRRFDDGHRFEALARPLAEAIIGDDLYPVTGSAGKLSASFDGLTMCETIGFEHKTLNAELRDVIYPDVKGFELPLHYQVQMEQQCMVSGAGRILFMASKWDGDELVESRHCWYDSNDKVRESIERGWEQFEVDLAEYVPAEATPAVIAAAVTALPSVSVNISGEIVVKDNFKAFEVALRDFIEHRLILKPETDQDFADLDLQIKALKGAESALDSAEVQMLSQVEAVDLAKRTKDMLHKLTRDNRLMAEKLLATRKEQIKGEIVAEGAAKLNEHIKGLNARLAGTSNRNYMPHITADFVGAIKGKRTIESLRDAMSTTLANAKIESSAIADKIDVNLTTLRELAAGHAFLFADAAQIVLKAPDDLTTLVKMRISEHKAAEEKKEAEQRERIRAEEVARLEREQRQAQEDEKALIASLWANANRIEFDSTPYIKKAIATFETAAKDWENDPRPRVVAAVTEARAQMAEQLAAATEREQAAEAAKLVTHEAVVNLMPATVVEAMKPQTEMVRFGNIVIPRDQIEKTWPTKAKLVTPPELRLGQINERLAPIQLTAEGLRTLGFEPAGRDRAAVLYHEADFLRICGALVNHISAMYEVQAA